MDGRMDGWIYRWGPIEPDGFRVERRRAKATLLFFFFFLSLIDGCCGALRAPPFLLETC
jgi:hypothetical protein